MSIVSMTPFALEKILSLKEQCPPHAVLKFSIDSTGVSGVHPTVEFDQLYAHLSDKSGYEDVVEDNLRIVWEKRWTPFLKGLTLDYYEGLENQGFIFKK